MQFRALFPVLGPAVRNRQGNFRRICTAVALAPIALLTAANASPDGVTVKVTVTDLRNTKGVVRGCITSDVKNFPNCRKGAAAHAVVTPSGAKAQLTFTGIKPGRYAIALLHDENNNDKMDRALMMMPKEGYGFSRDAKVRMGPPKFKDAAFDVTAEGSSQTIRMRYMF